MAAPSPTSKSAQSPTQDTKPPRRERLPPPTLFQAPPSNPLSLSLTRSRSPIASTLSLPLPPSSTTNANRPQPSSPQSKHPLPDTTPDADALWRSMQHTLAEVELTAASARNLHVFGPQHAAALAQLRGAQIALAQAWARGSGDGEGEAEDAVVEDPRTDTQGPAEGLGRDAAEGGKGKDRETGAGTGDGSGSGDGNGAAPKGRPRRGSKLAEETASDILLARKRREANDRYFARVSASVGDVVERLEGVADAMREVERESRDVWSSDGESSLGTSASASASAGGE